MNGWTARQNIENYKKRLEREADPARRRVLEEMLAQQQQILFNEKKKALERLKRTTDSGVAQSRTVRRVPKRSARDVGVSGCLAIHSSRSA